VKDHLGSIRAVVDPDTAGTETEKVVETRDYYPFGLRMPGRSVTEGTPAVEDYTGHELDAETGMHYAGARYHMSALGRWNGPDPLADDFPAWSPQAYSYNNPIGYMDPTGMAPCDNPPCNESFLQTLARSGRTYLREMRGNKQYQDNLDRASNAGSTALDGAGISGGVQLNLGVVKGKAFSVGVQANQNESGSLDPDVTIETLSLGADFGILGGEVAGPGASTSGDVQLFRASGEAGPVSESVLVETRRGEGVTTSSDGGTTTVPLGPADATFSIESLRQAASDLTQAAQDFIEANVKEAFRNTPFSDAPSDTYNR